MEGGNDMDFELIKIYIKPLFWFVLFKLMKFSMIFFLTYLNSRVTSSLPFADSFPKHSQHERLGRVKARSQDSIQVSLLGGKHLLLPRIFISKQPDSEAQPEFQQPCYRQITACHPYSYSSLPMRTP